MSAKKESGAQLCADMTAEQKFDGLMGSVMLETHMNIVLVAVKPNPGTA